MAGVGALALPPVATAHAVLLGTTPANDAVLQRAPAQVTLSFNEAVESAFGAVKVYDSTARRVDRGAVLRPTDRSVAVRLQPRLRRGTYTATWRVVSADSHPLEGAFVFHVGASSAGGGGVAAQVGSGGAPREVRILAGGLRAVQFALILFCIGTAFALLWTLTAAAVDVRSRVYAGLVGGGVGLAVAAVSGIVVQGAVASGVGLTDALSWEVVSSVLDTRYGRAWAATAAAALLLALAAALAARGSRTAGLVAFAVTAACAATPALVGHAHVAGRFATVVDVAHVLAAGLWAGGLAAVVWALLLARGSRWRLAATAVPRFSQTAVISVGALVLAGTIRGYLEIRALRGLWETTYGRLLLVKLGIVLPLLGLGAFNNRFAVPPLRDEIASPRERRSFVQRAVAELALIASVLAVTAVLVAEPPARYVLVSKGPTAADITIGPYKLNLAVEPAKVGSNLIRANVLRRDGSPADVAAVEVAASLPSAGLGPLRFEAHPLAPGHFAVHGAQLAVPGDWQFRVSVRRGEFDLFEQTVSIHIRED